MLNTPMRIVSFQTSDGEYFKDLHTAEEHQLEIDLIRWMKEKEDEWKANTKGGVGDGYRKWLVKQMMANFLIEEREDD
jgi:hypothetical protein